MTELLLIDAASTTDYGAVFTFLPLTASAAPAALLAAQVSSVAARLPAGSSTGAGRGACCHRPCP
ncbi:hypothetical protein [Streptomyces antibioticus]|uniref:hypothetical protein n=1 Tax=Streptomyces antibioticus TaxID=1890 RepID=UPI003409BA45